MSCNLNTSYDSGGRRRFRIRIGFKLNSLAQLVILILKAGQHPGLSDCVHASQCPAPRGVGIQAMCIDTDLLMIRLLKAAAELRAPRSQDLQY